MKHEAQRTSILHTLKALFLLFLLSLSSTDFLLASEKSLLSQNIRGKVLDEELGMPLIGANVVLVSAEEFTGAVTDLDGNFEIKNVPVGRHELRVSYLGYTERTLSNLLVNASKQLVLTIGLQESVVRMKAVEITAKQTKNKPQNELALISARGFSVEETQRYAGSFDDPARMAQSYAGVAAGDDGSNELVIRGNSPRGVLYKMEGMEIPNPSHFSEQGSGGGAISMLKGGMMANSDFYTGAFPAVYGNAASGVFEINLRKGNNQKREYAAQIGLLGVEGAIEGPFKEGYEGSYLVNYRYSTLDMLRAIGIDVAGDQTPVFQDLSYNINLPTSKAGNFTLFGLGGISYVKQELEGGEENFVTNMGVSGFTHKMLLGKKALWSTTGGLTSSKNHYFSEVYDSSEAKSIEEWNETFLSKNFRLSSNLNYKHNAQHSFKTGLIYSNLGFDMESSHYDWENKKSVKDLDADGRTGMLQGFVNWKYRLSEKWTVNSGVHYLHYLLNDQNSVEPRVAVQWQVKPKHTLSAGFGIHSRVEDPSVYLAQKEDPAGSFSQPNRNLAPWKARHYVLG